MYRTAPDPPPPRGATEVQTRSFLIEKFSRIRLAHVRVEHPYRMTVMYSRSRYLIKRVSHDMYIVQCYAFSREFVGRKARRDTRV